MTDTPEPNRKMTIIPPDRQMLRDSGRPMIVSAFARVRNQVLQKELASMVAKARTWNEFVETLRDGERLRQEYAASITRSENLDGLRAGEEAKVIAEVQKIFDDEADRQKERALRNTRLDAELIRAQRELDGLKNPSIAKPEVSRGKRRIAAVKQIREDRDEMVAIILDGRNEGDLTEEDRQLVLDIRLAADNEIKSVLEETGL